MGHKPSLASTKLTRALVSTYFAVGFCGDVSSALYDYAYTGSGLGFFTATSIAYLVSLFVGTLAPWPLSNLFKLGRKSTTFIGLLFLVLAAVLATSVVYFPQVTASQVCYGLGCGILYVTVILWRVETSEISRRGREVVLIWIAASAGAAVARWIRFGFSHVSARDVAWRVPLAMQFVVLLFPIMFVWGADESWRWLLQRNQLDKARFTLSRFMSIEQSSPVFQTTFAALVLHTRRTSTSRTLFPSKNTTPTSPDLRPYRRLFLAFALQTMRSLCGLGAASFYVSAATMVISGFRNRYALVAAMPSITFVFSLIPYFLIDRPSFSVFSPFGRRGLMLYGALGLSAMFLLATIVAATTGTLSVESWYRDEGMTLGAMIGFYVLFILAYLFYGLGFGSVVDLYVAEIAAGNLRVETLSIAMAWGVGVEVAMAFGLGFGFAGLGTYFFLAWLVLNLVWAVFIFLFYPETQGRSLETLDGMFVRGLKVLVGTDRDARRGRKIGDGVTVHDDESVGMDREYAMVAESQEALEGEARRGDFDASSGAVRKPGTQTPGAYVTEA